MGTAFTGPESHTGRAAGALFNSLSSAALGISKETPGVFVGRTSSGRTLVAEEYTEVVDVGGYKVVRSYGGGVQATTVAPNDPSVGTTPPNPANPTAALQFVRLTGPGAEPYSAWLNRGNETSGAQRSAVEALNAAPVIT